MSQEQPNILFIMADQWHHGDFGYRGHPIVRTPNIDRLQSRSIDFKHAYAQNAFCLPSRASIFTGQYLHTHRQYGFTGLFAEDVTNLPYLLRQHGYRTFHVGKYHCNTFGDKLGFDEFVPTLPEDMYQATDPKRTYMAWCRDNGLEYPNDQIQGDDFRAVYPPEPLELGGNVLHMYGTSEIPLAKSIERYTADQAIEFLERPHDGKPFFLNISFDRPHGPWSPSPEDVNMYNPDDIPLPESLTDDELERMPAHIRTIVGDYKVGLKKVGPEGMRKVLSLYYALVTRVDYELGRVLDVLEQTGQADNTAIVFCTDHGDMAGSIGLFDKHSNTIYHDDIITTPLLLKLPGSHGEPKQVEQCVELIDLFPTLCGLAGVDTDALSLDGKDLLRLNSAHEHPWGGTAFSESYGIKTVIKDGWKLIHYVNHDDGELYNLVEDPQERRNLYAESKYQEKRIDLLAELVNTFTPTPTVERQEYIRSLFDDSEITPRRAMTKLFKWDKGIIEGSGFWQSFDNGCRLTIMPFDNALRLEITDKENRTDGLFWNYHDVDNPDQVEAMLERLVDYISGKIRTISTMTGGDIGRDNMLFTKGFGFC